MSPLTIIIYHTNYLYSAEIIKSLKYVGLLIFGWGFKKSLSFFNSKKQIIILNIAQEFRKMYILD